MNRCILAVIVTLASSPLLAKGPKFTDPKKAGVDYQIQGEYLGDLRVEDGEAKFGVQVIALGSGTFRLVGYHGGLPGAGWNGEKPVVVKKSEPRKNNSVAFKDEHGSGVIKDGEMKVDLGDDGSVDGVLKRVVRKSPTLGRKPHEGALVLFDGKNADQWEKGRIEGGLLLEGTRSKHKFGSHQLHIEFQIPFQPQDRGQGRGNSGIYVQGRYEVQMLDSFGLAGKNNECGGIYEVRDPNINMCLPPLQWQTYDIEFMAAKFDDNGKLTPPAKMTVYHNGVLVHKNVPMPRDRSTRAAPLKPGPAPGPVFLQNHGCPVRYRNIWVLPTEK